MPLAPVARARHVGKEFAALADARTRRRAEGNDRLARKIVARHEAVDGPRRNAPPDGIAEKDGVVILPTVGRDGDELHAVLQFLVLVFLHDAARIIRPAEVVRGIGLDGHELKDVPARRLCDVICDLLGISRCRKVHDENAAGVADGLALPARGKAHRAAHADAGGQKCAQPSFHGVFSFQMRLRVSSQLSTSL